MLLVLLLTLLLVPASDGFGFSDLLRRLRPGRTRAPERRRPLLTVPLKGKMVWELTTPTTAPSSAPTTTSSTTLLTTAAATATEKRMKSSAWPTFDKLSGIGINITECNKVFLPEFVAILSNSSFGQAVLNHLGINQTHTTPAPEDAPELVFNECQAAFLPDFVAILSNSTMGQAVLENLQQQGWVTFRSRVSVRSRAYTKLAE